DHQMNLKVSEEFGLYFARIPLKTSPKIIHGNALTLDWNDVLPAERCSYVMGNPPFVGAKFMDDDQRADTRAVFDRIGNAGLLDFVAAWYVKTARYMQFAPSSLRGRAGERVKSLPSAPPSSLPTPSVRANRSVRCGAGC
ncbi:MAG: hypothetical protein Q8K35_01560, partial [Thiobacillus sp.]|nr:hypothetical protein [Thiobacillus sp.]